MTELLFLHSACRLMLVDTCIKFREYSLSGFQVIEWTRFVTDRQMDARGKTICLPTLEGGHNDAQQTLYHQKRLLHMPVVR